MAVPKRRKSVSAKDWQQLRRVTGIYLLIKAIKQPPLAVSIYIAEVYFIKVIIDRRINIAGEGD